MRLQFGTIFLLLFLWNLPGNGQDYTPEDRYLDTEIETRPFDRSKWAETVSGIDYDRKTSRRKRRTDEIEEPGNGNYGSGSNTFGIGAGTALARFLLITGGVIIIALLIWSILGYGNSAKNKKIRRESGTIDIRKIEENIHEADMDDYIQQAKNAGDFTLAVRLYYLAALKELSLKKLIKWKVDKTNGEYLREMRTHADFNEFRSLTYIFEQSWYGNRPLDADAFAGIEPRFERFIQHHSSVHQVAAS
ncbi:MAG: DUF4129 domain-containing protein [Saprospiraceae bacterium]|nr:DUF4129 domain-containing protein [Lewinella sp.]